MHHVVGDIVFVSKNKKNIKTSNHLFVIIDVEVGIAVEVNYLGLIVSSQNKKLNTNSRFKYNQKLEKSVNNGLKKDSHVKCDQLYSFNDLDISFKIGNIDVEDLNFFFDLLNKAMSEKFLDEIK